MDGDFQSSGPFLGSVIGAHSMSPSHGHDDDDDDDDDGSSLACFAFLRSRWGVVAKGVG